MERHDLPIYEFTLWTVSYKTVLLLLFIQEHLSHSACWTTAVLVDSLTTALKELYRERDSMQTSNVSSILLACYQEMIYVNPASCQSNSTYFKKRF
jgi:hypothetical protein